MNLREQKETLRQQMLEKRQSLSEKAYHQASRQIIERLNRQPLFRQAQNIHCYASMNSRREVDTHSLIRKILNSNKRLILPVTEFETGMLRHFELISYEDLESNQWGVLEPQKQKEVNTAELDLVIVPMVGGDRHCNRIGYGKGFYDRFLGKAECPAIGLCYDFCIEKQVPFEDFDIKLDQIVTETEVIC